jgi:O-antigen/teichoic acid export membrane protein
MISSTKTIFKQTSIYGIGNTFRKLSGVIILPLIKTYTTKEEFGIFILMETIFLFTMVLSGWGVKGGFNRWYYDMPSEMDKKSLFFTAGAFNSIITLFMVAMVGLLLYFHSSALLKFQLTTATIWYFSLGGIFRLFHDLPFILLRLLHKAKQQTLYASFNVFLTIVFTFYFLEIKEWGFEGIFAAQFWAHFITFLSLLPIYRKHVHFSFLGSELKAMINYGIPLLLSNILTTFLNLSDRHIINHYVDAAQSGNYGLATKVANLLDMIFVASFVTSFTYYYYKKMNDPESLKVFNKLQRFFLIILAVAGFGIVLFAREITWVVSSGDDFYQEGVLLIPFLILGLMFSGLRQLFTLPLNKHKKTVSISKVLITAGVINVGLNLVLVPLYGKDGAAWSTLFVQLVAMVWLYYESRKYEQINVRFGNAIKLLVVWLLFVVGSLYLPDSWWPGVLIKIVYGLGFLGSLIVLRVVDKEEVVEVFNTIRNVVNVKK